MLTNTYSHAARTSLRHLELGCQVLGGTPAGPRAVVPVDGAVHEARGYWQGGGVITADGAVLGGHHTW